MKESGRGNPTMFQRNLFTILRASLEAQNDGLRSILFYNGGPRRKGVNVIENGGMVETQLKQLLESLFPILMQALIVGW